MLSSNDYSFTIIVVVKKGPTLKNTGTWMTRNARKTILPFSPCGPVYFTISSQEQINQLKKKMERFPKVQCNTIIFLPYHLCLIIQSRQYIVYHELN